MQGIGLQLVFLEHCLRSTRTKTTLPTSSEEFIKESNQFPNTLADCLRCSLPIASLNQSADTFLIVHHMS